MFDVNRKLPFLEREQELETLTRFYRGHHRDKANGLFLYGRRGVGKTRLLDEFLRLQQPELFFYWQAPDSDSVTQLIDFARAWSAYVCSTGGATNATPPANWDRMFEQMASDIGQFDEPRLVIIENFTGLCHQEMAMSSLWTRTWDMKLQDLPQLRLILTGDHVSTMVREVLAYSAPFYLRVQYYLHLRPLRYETLIALFPQWSTE